MLVFVRSDKLNVKLIDESLEHAVCPDRAGTLVVIWQIVCALSEDPDATRSLRMRHDGLSGALLRVGAGHNSSAHPQIQGRVRAAMNLFNFVSEVRRGFYVLSGHAPVLTQRMGRLTTTVF
jgi:hypothetical protein